MAAVESRYLVGAATPSKAQMRRGQCVSQQERGQKAEQQLE
jgi:hypothetical protein